MKYYNQVTENVITKEEFMKEFENFKQDKENYEGETFENFFENCLAKNGGILVEII